VVLTLMVRLEGERELSMWLRKVDRPYIGVPAAGDSVFLGDGESGEGSMPSVVADVTWDNDGMVTLSFDLDGGDESEAELEQLGFRRL
jgi:hypothetical protein